MIPRYKRDEDKIRRKIPSVGKKDIKIWMLSNQKKEEDIRDILITYKPT